MIKLLYVAVSIIILLAISLPASATTVDEVIAMAEAGVSTDVILAVLDATESVFELSADDIVALEDAGIEDEIIIIMLAANGDEGYQETDPDGLHYLQLTDEQFRMLFLDRETSGASETSNSPTRQPEYYSSPGSNFSQGYITTPNSSYSSYNRSYSGASYNYPSTCNPGWTYSEYSYTYPGTYTYNRKYYSKTGYYTHNNPGYYIIGNTIYYPSNYSGHYDRYYDPYPKYYRVNDYRNRYDYYYPRSKVRMKVHSYNDRYFSLGFKF